jgi:hypothetical protein
MTTLQCFPLRIAALIDSFDQPQDVHRRTTPQFWRCNDIEFQIGVLRDNQPIDISNLDAIYLTIKALQADGSPPASQQPNLMIGHDANLQNISLVDWKNGNQQHATIRFSAEESAITSGNYWLSIWAITQGESSKILTLTAGHIRILENGGLSLSPPEPQALYYDAKTCDTRYLQKNANLNELVNFDAFRDSLVLGTIAGQDADDVSISGHMEITSGFISQIDDLAVEDGGTGASNATDAFQNLSPLAMKGDLLTSDGTSKGQRLPLGTPGQVLTVDNTTTHGLTWTRPPWQMITQQVITTPCATIDFPQVFDISQFRHYRLSIQNNTRSSADAQLQFVLGVSSQTNSPWLTTASDYRWQTFDIRGKTTRTESTTDIGECPYFPLGNSTTSYRSSGGLFHLNIDIWNDGHTEHSVSIAAIANYIWLSGTIQESGIGHYWGTHLNSSHVVIDSLRLQSTDNYLITGGIYSLYAIE